jgi:D-beta-D-heptose 7-phosphate kinase/D-beta-D-heptose 1-phosphate adenosyltransferase
VVRVDRENGLRLEPDDMKRIAARLKDLIVSVDAVIIEDYGKGFVTQTLVDEIFTTARKNDVIVTVDPNATNPLDWAGATLVKPNRAEAYIAANKAYDESEESLIEVGRILQKKWRIPYLLITLGEGGMILFHPPNEPLLTATKAKEVFDVSGAGDTAIAFFTAALSAGLSGAEASEIANHAAGVVVGKLGTATLAPEELVQAFGDE